MEEADKYSDGGPVHDPAWRVVIAPGPSRLAGSWVMAVLGAGLVALLWSGLPAAAMAACAAMLAGWSLLEARRHAGRARGGAGRSFAVDLAGRVAVSGADGSIRRGALAAGSFVAPWLVIVRWRPDGAWVDRTILVLPDAVPGDDFRRLRILLRWR